jgi:glycogen(starch) synthase
MSGRPLTVLMTADAVGGVWSFSVRLCAALPEARFVLATMGPRPCPGQRDEIQALANVTLVESDYRLEWMKDGAADHSESCRWLSQLIKRHGADIVHVNGYAQARLGADRPVLVVAHSDVLSWWQSVHKGRAPPEWDGYRRRAIAGLAAADRIIAPTTATLHDIQCHYLPLRGNAAVIANGIDVSAFRPAAKRPVVLAAGRLWDGAKNLAALDAIAPQLAWPVEIAGEVEHPDGGAQNYVNVHLLGRLDVTGMARRLGCAAIFAAPARYEPFGFAILEAAASGCALVLGNIPSLHENWDGAAVFVDPEDRPTLAAAINELIADAQQRTRLAAAARRRARRFTTARTAGAYAALYQDMAARARRKTA